MMVVIRILLLVRGYMRLLWDLMMIVIIAGDRSLMIIIILLSIGSRCILTPIKVIINAVVISIIKLTSGQCFVVKNKILCSDYHRSYQSCRSVVMVVAADVVVAAAVVGYV